MMYHTIGYLESIIIALLIQLCMILAAVPTEVPTYEPHPSMFPTPLNADEHLPTSFPTNEYHWDESTTIAVSIGSIIGGSAVVAAGYFAYSRGLFSPDDFYKSTPSARPSVDHTNRTHNPDQESGAKNPEMFPLLNENKA